VTLAPRLLFVTSSAFNHVTGGGVTFSNLFRSWPADRLATAHSDTVPTADDVCRLYYRLGPGELTRWPPRWRDGAAAPEAGPAAPPAGAPPLLRAVRTALVGNAWPDAGRLSPALERWIERFRPDVLYTILGTIGMMELVEAIRARFALPLVVHFMDDWPASLYRGGVAGRLVRARMERLLRRLVGAAAARMAIGDGMAEAFARRYGAPFLAFQNALDMARLLPQAQPRPAATPARILYVGSIFADAQLASLADAARAVAALAQAGRAVTLEIHAPAFLAARHRARLELPPAVKVIDATEDDDAFFRLIRGADLLLLPVNFDAASVRFIRHSMPTKIPAYLASGTPVLVYGPPGVDQVAYAAREGWGEVVGVRDESALRTAIARLLDDDGRRRAFVGRALDLARRSHDAATVRRRFQETLARAATRARQAA
jgi:glycosyltransferase involved in cell wall biosynthesis